MIKNFKNKKVKYIYQGSQLEQYHLSKDKTNQIKLRKEEKYIFLSSCFKSKQCFIEHISCYPNEQLCSIKDSEDKINEQLDYLLSYLYSKRGDFVHMGKVFSPHIESEHQYEGLYDTYENPISKNIELVFYQISLNYLFSVYEEALYNLFNK